MLVYLVLCQAVNLGRIGIGHACCFRQDARCAMSETLDLLLAVCCCKAAGITLWLSWLAMLLGAVGGTLLALLRTIALSASLRMAGAALPPSSGARCRS